MQWSLLGNISALFECGGRAARGLPVRSRLPAQRLRCLGSFGCCGGNASLIEASAWRRASELGCHGAGAAPPPRPHAACASNLRIAGWSSSSQRSCSPTSASRSLQSGLLRLEGRRRWLPAGWLGPCRPPPCRPARPRQQRAPCHPCSGGCSLAGPRCSIGPADPSTARLQRPRPLPCHRKGVGGRRRPCAVQPAVRKTALRQWCFEAALQLLARCLPSPQRGL